MGVAESGVVGAGAEKNTACFLKTRAVFGERGMFVAAWVPEASMPSQDSKWQGEFSVCQFFTSGEYEYFERFVSSERAVEAARHCCTSVGAKIGSTSRVIITDGGDAVNFEWQQGKGIVFPPELVGSAWLAA